MHRNTPFWDKKIPTFFVEGHYPFSDPSQWEWNPLPTPHKPWCLDPPAFSTCPLIGNIQAYATSINDTSSLHLPGQAQCSWFYLLTTRLRKVKIWTLVRAPLTWVRLMTSSALQSQKWQLIGMSQWCRSALCGHLLLALTDNWTHSAASRHTIAPISRTRPSPRSRSYYSFPVQLRVGGWVGLSTQ